MRMRARQWKSRSALNPPTIPRNVSELPPTPDGGQQHWFKCPRGFPVPSGQFAPGMWVRAEGDFAVLHHRQEVLDGNLSVPPDWLMELARGAR